MMVTKRVDRFLFEVPCCASLLFGGLVRVAPELRGLTVPVDSEHPRNRLRQG
jgi:hypothetical protein